MPKKVEVGAQITLYLENDELRWQLRAAALHRHIAMYALVTQILTEWLRAHPAT